MHSIENYIKEEYGINLGSQFKKALLTNYSIKKFKKGDFFLKEGKTVNHIGFVLSGKIMHYYNIEGKEITRWVTLDNNFITSFSSFINGTKSLENLICIEDVEIILYEKEYFQNSLMQFEELKLLWKKTLENNMIGYEHRIYQLITTRAKQRYLNFKKVYPRFDKEVPQKYVASMLGIEPRHLSRIKKELGQN